MHIRKYCLAGLSLVAMANAQTPTPAPAAHKAATQYATSADGTRIAYDKTGKGPAVIVVGGALSDRRGGAELAQLLSSRLTVYSFDRRGRGDSTDTQPYSVKREIEDIEALITVAGGTAHVYGKSSGAALALHAAADLGGAKVKKLALYEAPYSDANGAAQSWRTFRAELDQLLTTNRREEAIAHFMKFVGAPDGAVAGMKASPAWRGMLAMAPTLAYDNALLGEDRSVPVTLAARIESPSLVMDGGASTKQMPYMRVTADKLGKALPNAQRLTVEGQAHDVSAKALAPILLKFFTVE
jgi:pimeloyl-ACP methyl ester carboxylesterase